VGGSEFTSRVDNSEILGPTLTGREQQENGGILRIVRRLDLVLRRLAYDVSTLRFETSAVGASPRLRRNVNRSGISAEPDLSLTGCHTDGNVGAIAVFFSNLQLGARKRRIDSKSSDWSVAAPSAALCDEASLSTSCNLTSITSFWSRVIANKPSILAS